MDKLSAQTLRFAPRGHSCTGDSEILRLMERHKAVLPGLAARLGNHTRSSVSARLLSVEEENGATFVNTMASCGFLVKVVLPREGVSGVLTLGTEIVPLFLDLILGGSGADVEPLQRPLTKLEKSLLRSVLEIAVEELAKAWGDGDERPVTVAEPEATRRWEEDDDGEPRIGVAIELTCRETTAVMRIYLPIEVLALLDQAPAETKAASPELILRRLAGAPMSLELSLPGLSVTVADLVSLRPGDTVVFDCPESRPIQLSINGSDRFAGRLGEKCGRRVFVIDKVLK